MILMITVPSSVCAGEWSPGAYRIFLLFRKDDLCTVSRWYGTYHESWTMRDFNLHAVFHHVKSELDFQMQDKYRPIIGHYREVGSVVDHTLHSVSYNSFKAPDSFENSYLNLELPGRWLRVIECIQKSQVFEKETTQLGTFLGSFLLSRFKRLSKEKPDDWDMDILLHHLCLSLFHWYKTVRYSFESVMPYLEKIRERRGHVRRLDY